ncbi:hypothetical protein CASFOL_013601 [Castilleja foliolosa]|uniref:MD-2-related lipid-recognition domain-containing protein n=1 Tax=Castilleja foliolosa TaxID=1961234 RepID=A0ABD3DKG4_9LAMI
MAQMKFLGDLVFALCLLVPLISAKTTSVKYCNTKNNYAVKVNALDIDPYPISKGKNTKFQITASTDEAISGGKLVIDVSYFGFHIHSEDHDLCDETSCPVSAGEFNVTHAQELPGYTPPGSYTLEMKMVDGGGKQLTCITFGFSIGFIAEENNLADI